MRAIAFVVCLFFISAYAGITDDIENYQKAVASLKDGLARTLPNVETSIDPYTARTMSTSREAGNSLRHLEVHPATKRKNYIQLSAATQMAMGEQDKQFRQLNSRVNALKEANIQKKRAYDRYQAPSVETISSRMKNEDNSIFNANTKFANDRSAANAANTANEQMKAAADRERVTAQQQREARQTLQEYYPSAFNDEYAALFNALNARVY